MNLGLLGTALAMGIAAIGSAVGIGIAGQASIGSWKKCYMSNKASDAAPAFLLGLRIASSAAMAFSAIFQGKSGATGADALAETGKGFPQYITVVGLCETVALFTIVFSMVALG